MEVEALLGGEQSFVWSAAAAAAGLRKRRGRERGDRALEAELRAWKSLGGPGDSALCLACLFTCAANSPRALPALPGADPEPDPLGPPLAGCRPDCCNWEDRRAARLQSEWAAEMYWGVRGDASVTRDLLAILDAQMQGGSQGGTQDEGPLFRKVLGYSGYLAVKREQHVHGRQAAIKITTSKHAPSLSSARHIHFRYEASVYPFLFDTSVSLSL